MNTHGNRGKFLEELALVSQVGVVLDQIPTGAKIIKIGNKQTTVPIKTLVDMIGAVTFKGPMQGRALIFDCKECGTKHRLELGENKMNLDQRRILTRWKERSNAIAGVLARSTFHNRIYWLDAAHLMPIRPSFQWDEPPMVYLGPSTQQIDFKKLIALYTPCD